MASILKTYLAIIEESIYGQNRLPTFYYWFKRVPFRLVEHQAELEDQYSQALERGNETNKESQKAGENNKGGQAISTA